MLSEGVSGPLCHKMTDTLSRFMDVFIGVEMNFFFLEGTDQLICFMEAFMQELLQELYPEETITEGETLFTLDLNTFQTIWGSESWIKLQQEFNARLHWLSRSFLIWTEPSGQGWILADFGNKNTYRINSLPELGQPLAEVSELPDLDNQLQDSQTICKLLLADSQTGRSEPQGTLAGFIALIMKLDLGEVDLDRLKRSDLSGGELDFESVHQEIVVIHDFFREILTSSSVSNIPLSEAAVQAIRTYLPRFFLIIGEIKDFNVRDVNPTEKHTDLLQKITELYHEARYALDPIISYLRSTQMGKSQAEFTDFFQDATSKWKEFDAKSEAKLQELEKLKIERENQLATTSIADHVIFFDEQAKKHQIAAMLWGVGAVIFAGLFVWGLWDAIKITEEATTVTAVLLQNFFKKGFLLSVFYIFLNRFIKNYTAEKHLEVINLHRKNALATFDAFADAAGENRDTRDHVLMAATDAIFDANQSGYLSGKTSRSDSSNLIQQIFRSVMPNK